MQRLIDITSCAIFLSPLYGERKYSVLFIVQDCGFKSMTEAARDEPYPIPGGPRVHAVVP